MDKLKFIGELHSAARQLDTASKGFEMLLKDHRLTEDDTTLIYVLVDKIHARTQEISANNMKFVDMNKTSKKVEEIKN